jgi:hypothetical protein
MHNNSKICFYFSSSPTFFRPYFYSMKLIKTRPAGSIEKKVGEKGEKATIKKKFFFFLRSLSQNKNIFVNIWESDRS